MASPEEITRAPPRGAPHGRRLNAAADIFSSDRRSETIGQFSKMGLIGLAQAAEEAGLLPGDEIPLFFIERFSDGGGMEYGKGCVYSYSAKSAVML